MQQSEPTEPQIGLKLRQIRKSRKMTLEDLADQTGFTKSYLSKIENSKKTPPIGSLAKICSALDTEIAELFNEGDEGARPAFSGKRYCVVRAEERHTVVRGGTSFGYDYKSLAHRLPHKRMDPFLFTFRNGSARKSNSNTKARNSSSSSAAGCGSFSTARN